MVRWLPVSFAAIFTAGLLGAPKPEVKKPPVYMPTAVGTTWVYDDEGQEWAEEVTKAEVKGDQTVVTIRCGAPGESAIDRTVAVSAAGVFERAHGPYKFDPALCLLKLPAKADQAWNEKLAPQKGLTLNYEGRRVAGAPEKVVVPAGTFEAVPVRLEISAEDDVKLERPRVLHTMWWAPDVGVVRLQAEGIDRKLK
jgi:hypothetical protein